MGQAVDIETLVGKRLISIHKAEHTGYFRNIGTAKKPVWKWIEYPFHEMVTLTFDDGSVYTIERENALEDTSVTETMELRHQSRFSAVQAAADWREAEQIVLDGSVVKRASYKHLPFGEHQEVLDPERHFMQKDKFFIMTDVNMFTVIFHCSAASKDAVANVQLWLQDTQQED